MNPRLRAALPFIVIVVVLLAIGLFLILRNSPETDELVYCPQDAQLCPDGSYVGRVPPTCEFAACPLPGTSASGFEAGLNQMLTIGNVRIIPLSVLEDSRCPIDVQCIQAGTVRLRATLSSGLGTTTQVFVLNTPITTEAEIIELIAVSPATRAGITISPTEYRFTFRVTKRTEFPDGKG